MAGDVEDRARAPRTRARRKKKRRREDEAWIAPPKIPEEFNPYAPPVAVEAPRKRKRKRRLTDATLGQRFAHMVIDGIVVLVANFVLGGALGIAIVLVTGRLPAENSPSLQIAGYAVGAFAHFAYFCGAEALFGRTIGKLVTGTRVVAEDGKPASFRAIALRTLVRWVPFEPFSFFGEGGGRWHDRWSKTRVVRNESP